MKVVTRLEDINTEIWCFATKENFEFLKSIGIKFHYNAFEEFSNQEDFDNLDVFRFAKSEYIGIINNNTPAKWNSEGVCLIPGNTYNLYKEYKQRIYTKPNPAEFYPRQKFIISSTEKMSTSFEKQGWGLATNEEIEEFKF